MLNFEKTFNGQKCLYLLAAPCKTINTNHMGLKQSLVTICEEQAASAVSLRELRSGPGEEEDELGQERVDTQPLRPAGHS